MRSDLSRVVGSVMLLTACIVVAGDDPQIGDKPLSALLKQMQSENRGLQVRAARALSEAPPALKPQIAPKVISLLKSYRENDRFVAAQFLGECGPAAKAAVPDLVPMLQGTQYERNRAAAAKALGQILKDAKPDREIDEVTAALVEAFKDSYEDVRREAVTACGMIGQAAKACIPHMTPLLKEPPGAQYNMVSVAAAWTCERMGPLAKEQTDLLIALMHRYASEQTPAYVLALGAIGLVNESVIPNIVNKIELYDGDAAVEFKVGAWKVLGQFGEKAAQAVPLMKRYLKLTGESREFFQHRMALLDAARALGPVAKDLLPEIETLKTYSGYGDWRIPKEEKDRLHADLHKAAEEAVAAIKPQSGETK